MGKFLQEAETLDNKAMIVPQNKAEFLDQSTFKKTAEEKEKLKKLKLEYKSSLTPRTV